MYFKKKYENFEGDLNIVLGCSASCAFSCLDFCDFEEKLQNRGSMLTAL